MHVYLKSIAVKFFRMYNGDEQMIYNMSSAEK